MGKKETRKDSPRPRPHTGSIMAFHHKRDCKTACTTSIQLCPSHFHFLWFAHRHLHSKRAPTDKADTVCSPEKSADSQHKGKPICVRGHRSTAKGATRCQVNRHGATSFHTSLLPEPIGPKSASQSYHRQVQSCDPISFFTVDMGYTGSPFAFWWAAYKNNNANTFTSVNQEFLTYLGG